MGYPKSNIWKHYLGTTQHKLWVAFFICGFICKLIKRAFKHDLSKYSMEESRGFFQVIGKLKDLTYGSPEYNETLAVIKPSIDKHYAKNSHHPEHHKEGISGFDLIDLIEMWADWKSAVRRHADGNIFKSIAYNKDRFKMGDVLPGILESSAKKNV